jgi:hypothetical protein
MKVERISYLDDPEKIATETFDCLWISFHGRELVRPLSSKALQWVDWRLQGVLSRFIVEEKFLGGKITFVPTMHRLPTPYVALESVPDWTLFQANCEGLKFKHVLYFCEDGKMVSRAEKELSGQKHFNFPETVTLGSELPVSLK